MRFSLNQVKEAGIQKMNYSNRLLNPLYETSTYLFANFTNFSPNFITTFSLMFGLVSAYLFFKTYFVLGALSWLLRHLLDAVDGRLARLKKKTSKFGSAYDSFASYISTIAVLAALFLSAGEKFLLVLIPFLIIMFFIYPLQKITLNILVYKVNPRKYKEFMDYCDLRRFIFILLPLFHGPLTFLPINYKTGLLLVLFLTFVKQLTWIFYYRKEFKDYHIKSLEEVNIY